MLTPADRAFFRAKRDERKAAIQEVAEMECTLEQIVNTARDEGTLGTPKPAEPWDAERNYITGDTATEGETQYVALKYNKGKLPSKFKQHWNVVK